jgi:hypothetical protein
MAKHVNDATPKVPDSVHGSIEPTGRISAGCSFMAAPTSLKVIFSIYNGDIDSIAIGFKKGRRSGEKKSE